MFNLSKHLRLALVFLALLCACAEDQPTFTLLSEKNVFQQSSATLDNRVDVLWVIDNSGSMLDLQNNVAGNFNSFIQSFVEKGYDFQIAVTVTDAWRAETLNNPILAKFRDGTDQTSHTGVFIIDPNTPDVIDTFMVNMIQGASGSGDERAFESMKLALSSDLNQGFPRENSYLAVIIVSDEDDFSWSGAEYLSRDYDDPRLEPVSNYVSFLDELTGSTEAVRNYSVSAIAIWDEDCLAYNMPWGITGQRYGEMVEATDGVKGDVCSESFAQTLETIQTRIIELSTQFFLSRLPIVETIVVRVNGVVVPQDATNGWTYHADTNSIRFHGSFVPPQGATIEIDFDPLTIK